MTVWHQKFLRNIINKARDYISEDNKKIELMINNIKNKSESLDRMRAELEGLREAARMNQEKWEEEKLGKKKMKFTRRPMKIPKK